MVWGQVLIIFMAHSWSFQLDKLKSQLARLILQIVLCITMVDLIRDIIEVNIISIIKTIWINKQFCQISWDFFTSKILLVKTIFSKTLRYYNSLIFFRNKLLTNKYILKSLTNVTFTVIDLFLVSLFFIFLCWFKQMTIFNIIQSILIWTYSLDTFYTFQ